MASEASLQALASLAAQAAQQLLTPEELLEELAPFFRKKAGVVKIVEHARGGSVGRFCSQLCLLPGRRFELGTRVTVEVLPTPPGLPWTCWAVEASEEPEGWSHVERAASHVERAASHVERAASHVERAAGQRAPSPVLRVAASREKGNAPPWRSGRGSRGRQ
jgi:hypothetical protein